jgi:thiol-disulfide isomerase/thioredoxin
MKFLKYMYILLFPVVMVTSCGAIKGTVISGTVKGAENMTVYLDEVLLTQQPNILAQATAGADGSFKISFPEGVKKGSYKLRIGDQGISLLFDGSEKEVVVGGALTDFNNFSYTVTGSKLSEQYLQAVKDYINKVMDVPALMAFTEKTADPLVGYQIALSLFTIRPEFIQLHKAVAGKMKTSYPDLKITSEYEMVVSQIERQELLREASALVKVGAPAPEISLPDPNGKVRKLSDYKGKLVLIDFWASWCGPCRKANPHVVEVYNKYKGKGFDVFSVSLDGLDSRKASRFPDAAQLKEQVEISKQKWLAAIQQDQLAWDGHVSDLKSWESVAAGTYGVTSIPMTFLVGRDGNVVAINPRHNLEEQVLKFL